MNDLANTIEPNSHKHHSYYLTGDSEIHFQFQEINEESILKMIDNSSGKSISGCNVIILKHLNYLKYNL